MSAALTPPSVVILAAGLGTRMKSPRPKVLQPLCGRPMIAWVVDQALGLEPERIVVVAGHGADDLEQALVESGQRDKVEIVIQEPQLGTGHAVQVAAPALFGGAEPSTVVVLYGDMPCLDVESLRELLQAKDDLEPGASTMLTACPDDPRGFGRVLFSDRDNDRVRGIVEEKDASPEELAIDEVNLGVYAFDGPGLKDALPRLSNDNAQGELYLTDVVAMLVEKGAPVVAVELDDEGEAIGVNNLAHLAEARWVLQMRILEEHLINGVFIEDPASAWIDHGVTIGQGTRILPSTVIRSGVVIGKDCEVGPFTHLRVGTVLEEAAEVGNFTECKQSIVGAHSKAKHLSYLGDARIGARTNIGAGTIFANYDGKEKHVTVVGDGAFIGSGTIVVAPNTIGAGATTGAGAVITRGSEVEPNSVWVGVPARPLRKQGPS